MYRKVLSSFLKSVFHFTMFLTPTFYNVSDLLLSYQHNFDYQTFKALISSFLILSYKTIPSSFSRPCLLFSTRIFQNNTTQTKDGTPMTITYVASRQFRCIERSCPLSSSPFSILQCLKPSNFHQHNFYYQTFKALISSFLILSYKTIPSSFSRLCLLFGTRIFRCATHSSISGQGKSMTKSSNNMQQIITQKHNY